MQRTFSASVAATDAVTFPLFAKHKVKGRGAAPLYEIMSRHPDDDGKAGNVSWNIEKFRLDHNGHVMRRFRSKVKPGDPKMVSAIEALLAAEVQVQLLKATSKRVLVAASSASGTYRA